MEFLANALEASLKGTLTIPEPIPPVTSTHHGKHGGHHTGLPTVSPLPPSPGMPVSWVVCASSGRSGRERAARWAHSEMRSRRVCPPARLPARTVRSGDLESTVVSDASSPVPDAPPRKALEDVRGQIR